jgi:uncharacterized protein DUF4288
LSKGKNWFAVRLLFESQHPEEPGVDSMFEDRIILVSGSTEDEVRQKAESYGHSEESTYRNVYEKTIREVFLEILDVVEISSDQIEDLTEVYHQFLTPKELKHVRRTLEPLPDDAAAPLKAS